MSDADGTTASTDLRESFRLLDPDASMVLLEELERVFWSLNNHFDYLSLVQLDLIREEHGASLHYGLDFSDIYAYVHPFARDARHSQLVELEIERLPNLSLLPGTLAELFNFFQDYVGRQAEADDSSFIREIARSEAARDYVAAYESDAPMPGLTSLRKRLFDAFPIVRAIRDHEYAGDTLSRLKDVLARLALDKTDRTDDIRAFDTRIYFEGWEALGTLRPGSVLNNRVDAFNYAVVAGRSKSRTDSYFALLTCSRLPRRAFRPIVWEDDPLRQDARLMQSAYDFSFVRDPIYAAYLVLLKEEADSRGIAPVEFASEARAAISQLHTQLGKLFPLTRRSLSASMRSTGATALGEAARVTGQIVSDVLDLQAKYFDPFLARISSVLEDQAIAGASRDGMIELYDKLRRPDSLVYSIRYSYERLASAYRAFLEDVAERWPEVAAEVREEMLSAPTALRRSAVLQPVKRNEFTTAFEDEQKTSVLYLELFEGECFSLYWHCAVDPRRFLRLASDIIGLLASERFSKRIPVFASKRSGPALALRNVRGTEVIQDFVPGERSDVLHLFDELVLNRKALARDPLSLVRVNSNAIDMWCHVAYGERAPLLCGLLSHWNCFDVVEYAVKLSSSSFIPDGELRKHLRPKLERYPSLTEGRGSL